MSAIKSRSKNDFSPATARKIAQSAMFVCSNPLCLRFTGYSTTEGKPRSIAEAAHINAAGQDGPRVDLKLDSEFVRSADNGIWLCLGCHEKIDNDPKAYPRKTLEDWRKLHTEAIRQIVGKDLESALLDLRGFKQYHAECREFLSFIDGKRVFYEAFDAERPQWVKESLDGIRYFVAHLRARVSQETILFSSLEQVQQVILKFLTNIGRDTDLDTLVFNSNDPKWVHFCRELKSLRSGIIIIVTHLAKSCEYPLSWLKS
jgi:hypothetical protein